jgi:glycosyltransferase involved in cell wall biosynthesis
VSDQTGFPGDYNRDCNDDITVVIPAYNEVRTIRDLVERTLMQVKHVIVVDDGSSDGTAHPLVGLAITLIKHDNNQGKAASLWDGMREANKRQITAIVTLDGDGQHLPEDIPRLVQYFRQVPNRIVIGSRLHEKANIPRARYNANRFANFWVSWAAGYPICDSQSGFRVYPADLLDKVSVAHHRSSGFVFESEILIEAGRLGITSAPISISAIYLPQARASHFRPVVDIARIVRMIAWKIISRGFYPSGLWRSLQKKTAHQ